MLLLYTLLNISSKVDKFRRMETLAELLNKTIVQIVYKLVQFSWTGFRFQIMAIEQSF